LIAVESNSNLSVASFAVTIYNKAGTKLVNADIDSTGQVIDLKKGRTIVRLRIEQLHLNPDIYTLGLWLNKTNRILEGKPLDYIESVCEIEVVNSESKNFGIKEASPVTCKFRILEIT
jgi:hypothetical protein